MQCKYYGLNHLYFEGIFMASKTSIIRSWIFAAITELFEQEYLLDSLDWDVKGNKYTLRIRGADRRPMVGVGLITFSGTSGNISFINAVTGHRETMKADVESKESKQVFLNNVFDFAKQLRDEAAYK